MGCTVTPDAIRRAIGHASAAELAEGLNAALDYMSGGWFPSAGTRAEMLSESYVLSEVTNQAGEA